MHVDVSVRIVVVVLHRPTPLVRQPRHRINRVRPSYAGRSGGAPAFNRGTSYLFRRPVRLASGFPWAQCSSQHPFQSPQEALISQGTPCPLVTLEPRTVALLGRLRQERPPISHDLQQRASLDQRVVLPGQVRRRTAPAIPLGAGRQTRPDRVCLYIPGGRQKVVVIQDE